MAIEIYERPDSRSFSFGSGAKVDLQFMARGSLDDTEIKDAVYAFLANDYSGVLLSDIEVEPLSNSGIWHVKVNYSGNVTVVDDTIDPDEENELKGDFGFNLQAGTVHITQSIETKSVTTRPGSVAPAFNRAIGVDHASVAGTDIGFGKLEFSLTKQIPFITLEYIKKLRQVMFTTNREAFQTFDAGEVLFMGVTNPKYTGDMDQINTWELTFNFAVSQNIHGLLIVSDEITILSLDPDPAVNVVKGGWDYLWVDYEDSVDAIANLGIRRPRSAIIEKVYFDEDFGLLGIGN